MTYSGSCQTWSVLQKNIMTKIPDLLFQNSPSLILDWRVSEYAIGLLSIIFERLALTRNSRQDTCYKKSLPKKCKRFTWKYLCRSPFLNNATGCRPANAARVFSCEICEINPEQYFYRTPLSGCFFFVLIYPININLVEVCSRFSE